MAQIDSIHEKNNADKLAFPSDGVHTAEARSRGDAGLTKREYFAAKAMQGILSNEMTDIIGDEDIPQYAVEMADALIKALEE